MNRWRRLNSFRMGSNGGYVTNLQSMKGNFLLCWKLSTAASRSIGRDRAVSKVTGYRLEYWGSISCWRTDLSPLRPDRKWGSPSLLPHAQWQLLYWKYSDRRVKLTTCLHLMRCSGSTQYCKSLFYERGTNDALGLPVFRCRTQ